MVTHARAREYADGAYAKAFGVTTAPVNGVALLTAIAHLETRYGQGWQGAGRGSNNMGAIQAGAGWTGETFVYRDSRPNPDGTSTIYTAKFRKYASPELGWKDLALVAFGGRRHCVRLAAEQGCAYSASEYLHRTRYYEGFGATVAERRWGHFTRLRACRWGADKALGLPTPDAVDAVPPTLRMGDHNDFVVQLQRELQGFREIDIDGAFGPQTEDAVRGYQLLHWLGVDGIVGPATWTELLTDDYEPVAA